MFLRSLLPALCACFVLVSGPSVVFAQAPPPAAPAESQPLVVLRLADNTLLVGHIVREEGDTIVFDAGKLGQFTLKTTDVISRLEPATVAAAFAGAGAGQTPASGGSSAFQEPGKVRWTRYVTLGGNYTSSAYKQGTIDPALPDLTGEALKLPGTNYMVQGTATFVRAASRGISFLEGSYTYAFFEPFGKQADVPKISGGYNFRFKSGKKLYGVTRYTWYKDEIRQIEYSNQGIFGVGIHTVDSPRVKLDVVPGLALMKEKKGTPLDGKWEGGFGFLEQLTISPNQFAQIEQRELYYQLFTESSYRGLESYIGFKGMLSKKLGVQFGFSHIYDNAIAQRPQTVPANSLFPGQAPFVVFANNKTQVLITFGVLATF